jgi:hypothetical protein
MPAYTFSIADAFPANDPVARFVTVLAMVINDWHRTMEMMVTASAEDPEGKQAETRGIRLMLARQEAAACFEATKFIDNARKRFTEIEAFVQSLGPEAQEYIDAVEAAADRRSPERLGWLEDHRNVTSHYPELSREKHAAGNEEIANALMKTASIDLHGTVTIGETDHSLRFHYADEVAVQLLPDVTKNPELIKKLADARMAIGRFAGLAFAAYREAHADAFTFKR